MRFYLQLPLSVFLAAVLISCNMTVKEQELPAAMQQGKDYYTQVAMHYEKGQHSPANFGIGQFLPVNSEVEFIELQDNFFAVEIDSTDQRLEFSLNPEYSNDTLVETFTKLFAAQPLDLNKFNELEQKNIKSGSVDKGMSRAAVLVAKGYPPSVSTPSLDSNEWKYWWSEWTTFLVIFADDRVLKVTDKVIEK